MEMEKGEQPDLSRTESRGTVTIAPWVLHTIVRMAALATPGVARLGGGWLADAERLLGRPGGSSGVEIEVQDNAVTVDLYLVAERGANILKLGQILQTEITRAIQDMIGMEVSAVNVHIQDVVCPGSQAGGISFAGDQEAD
jgi:uncharacterized alkaline shock family protein YloU